MASGGEPPRAGAVPRVSGAAGAARPGLRTRDANHPVHVSCESQDEVDTYWRALSDGGEEGPVRVARTDTACHGRSTPCGFTSSWRTRIETADRVMRAMLEMRNIDIAELSGASGVSARPVACGIRRRGRAASRVAEGADDQHDVPARLLGAAT